MSSPRFLYWNEIFTPVRKRAQNKPLGTTWLQEIVWQMHHQGEISSVKSCLRTPLLEMVTRQHWPIADIKTMPSPRVIKTHLPYNTIPKGVNEDAQCKYIYVARNPRDVAVSYFHFSSTTRPFNSGYNGPWEFFFKLFVEGKGKFVVATFRHLKKKKKFSN